MSRSVKLAVRTLEARDVPAAAGSQMIYLDFDGASDVSYRGPIQVNGLDIPALDLSSFDRAGGEALLMDTIARRLSGEFRALSVRFVTQEPTAGPYSTIYVGGDNAAFAAYGPYLGLAEKNDVHNRDRTDNALVFSDSIADANRSLFPEFVTHLTNVITHESKRLLGQAVAANSTPASSPLDEVANRLSPYLWHFPVGDPRYGTGTQEDQGNSANWYHSQAFGAGGGHLGLDLSIPGTADYGKFVHAAAPGQVVWIGEANGWVGTSIIIRHDTFDQWGKDVYSMYSHLQPNVLVTDDQWVIRGQQIGRVGSYPGGQDHLHFEIGWGGDVADNPGPGYRGYTFSSSTLTMTHPNYPGRVWKNPKLHIQQNLASGPTVTSVSVDDTTPARGQTVQVTWQTNPNGVIDHMAIYLDGPGGISRALTENFIPSSPGGGSRLVVIPTDISVGSGYSIKVVAWGSPWNVNPKHHLPKAITIVGTNPEVAVLGNGLTIFDNDTTPSSSDGTNYGSVAQGASPPSRTFTVRNDGTAPLSLGGVSVPSGFTLTDGLTGSLPPGTADTFTVRLDTGTAGTKSGQINFGTNDPDENPFNFSIVGVVTSSGSVPATPTGVFASDGFSDMIRVTWNPVSGATYEVWRSTSNNSGTATRVVDNFSGTLFDDTTVPAGTIYFYWVKAENSFGTSGFSSSDSGQRASTGPANNHFANRISISGSSATVAGTNVNATKETGEPNHAGFAGGKSVWWSWTAPASGSVTMATAGSNYDTLLHVYTGSTVAALTGVVGNDDEAPGVLSSRVTFNAVAGTTYPIAVDGWNAASGNITLNVSQAASGGLQYDQDRAFQAFNVPTHRLHLRNSEAFIDPYSSSEQFRLESTFRIRRGLADPNAVSFESITNPGYFLRHSGYRLVLAPHDGSSLFRADATFHARTGLASASGYSFESFNYPGHYLRHWNYEMWLDPIDGSSLFREDATFNAV